MIVDRNPNRNEQFVKEFHAALDGIRRMESGLGDLEIAKDDSLPATGGIEWRTRRWVDDISGLEMIDFRSVANGDGIRVRITPIGDAPTHWHVIVSIEGYDTADVTAVHVSAGAALGFITGFIKGVIFGQHIRTDMANADFLKSWGFGGANEFGLIQFNQVKYDERKE